MRNASAVFACAATFAAYARAEPASAAYLERGFWRSLSGASGAIYVRYNADRDYHAVGFGYWSPLSDGSGTVLDAPIFMDEAAMSPLAAQVPMPVFFSTPPRRASLHRNGVAV